MVGIGLTLGLREAAQAADVSKLREARGSCFSWLQQMLPLRDHKVWPRPTRNIFSGFGETLRILCCPPSKPLAFSAYLEVRE